MDDEALARDQAELIKIQKEKQLILQQIERLRQEIKQVQHEIDDIDMLDVEVVDDKLQKSMRTGRKLFNEKAKKGIEDLVANGLLEKTPRKVAEFLLNTEGLNKTQIGEYLGDFEPFNLEVLDNFAKIHDFVGQDFDTALRSYLWSFRLPGESQKIDRMMESFAKRYCECNPQDFSHPDTCYVLAFSTIMLNTSLHNPACKIKTDLESFINMNRGIDQGKDLDPALLKIIYESISVTPFKIPEDEDGLTYTFFNPERSGYIVKEGGGHKSWKTRWFTLVNNCLYYFEEKDDTKPKGTIPLENLVVRECPDHKKPNVFEVLCEGDVVKGAKVDRHGKFVKGKHTSYKLQAPSVEEREEWIKCIRAAMTKDPFYELFRNKRENATTMSY